MAKPKKTVTTTTTTTTVTHDNKAKEQYDYLCLDRSGSMASIWRSTINGVNEYIGKIKRDSVDLGLKSFVSLLKFDDKFTTTYEYAPVGEVKTLDMYTDGPRGGTALNDAVAMAIRSLKTRLFGREASPDVDVTITVFTDGEENSSVEFPNQFSGPNKAIAALIKDVQDRFGWTVTFVGAGNKERVQHVAHDMGILASNVANYAATDVGVKGMMLSMESARSVKSTNYAAGLKSNVGYFTDPNLPKSKADEPNPIDPLAENDSI